MTDRNLNSTTTNDREPTPEQPDTANESQQHSLSTPSNVGWRTVDRFGVVNVGTDSQVNIFNLFKSLIDLNLTGPTFRTDVAEALTVEELAQPSFL